MELLGCSGFTLLESRQSSCDGAGSEQRLLHGEPIDGAVTEPATLPLLSFSYFKGLGNHSGCCHHHDERKKTTVYYGTFYTAFVLNSRK